MKKKMLENYELSYQLLFYDFYLNVLAFLDMFNKLFQLFINFNL